MTPLSNYWNMQQRSDYIVKENNKWQQKSVWIVSSYYLKQGISENSIVQSFFITIS